MWEVLIAADPVAGASGVCLPARPSALVRPLCCWRAASLLPPVLGHAFCAPVMVLP